MLALCLLVPVESMTQNHVFASAQGRYKASCGILVTFILLSACYSAVSALQVRLHPFSLSLRTAVHLARRD